MKSSEVSFNRGLALLVLVSFAIFMSAVVLRVGIDATPYETTDAAGRAMGFNDPLSSEHYLIMIRNFRVTNLLKPEHVYEWVLIAAHLVGAGLLLSASVRPRFTRWFFALQAIAFPWGVPGLLFLPMFIAQLSGHSIVDRESFIDVPFIAFVAHPAWIATSLFITFTLRGPGLGLAGVWMAIRRGTRTGRRKVAAIVLR